MKGRSSNLTATPSDGPKTSAMDTDGGAQLFYALAAGSMLACWAALSLGPAGDFHRPVRSASTPRTPTAAWSPRWSGVESEPPVPCHQVITHT